MENLSEAQVVPGFHLIKGEFPIDCASLNLSVCPSPSTQRPSPKSLQALRVYGSSRFYAGSFQKEAEVVSVSWELQQDTAQMRI